MASGARRALITGGAGFIGAALAREFVAAGCCVAIVDDLSTGSLNSLRGVDAQFHRVDMRDTESVTCVLQQFEPDVVFHLAALHYIPDCIADADRTWDLNVGGTRSVLAACLDAGVNRVVFASTAAVYASSSEACREDVGVGPIEIYGETKVVGEQLVEDFCRRTRGHGLVARFFNVYGPGDTTPHVIPSIIAQAQRSSTLTLGALDPKRDYVHVDDVVEALIRLDERRLDGFQVVNIGTGHETSVAELVDVVAGILREHMTVRSEASLYRPIERMHLLADVSRLRTLVGWRPSRPLRDGLAALLDVAPVSALPRS